MKRIIITAPEGVTLDSLTPEQQQAIRSVFTQFVLPMPGTKPSSGLVLIDAVVGDNFMESEIAAFSLPFTVIGKWQWDGVSAAVEMLALDTSFINYLPDVATYDETGETVLYTTPAVLHEPHRWAGWPPVSL